MQPKAIKLQTPPTFVAGDDPLFMDNEFERMVWEKGYDVWHESAIKCPCKVKGAENFTTCSNCLGTGWVFLDKIQTRMVVQSQNMSTKYKEWSEEKIGTMNVTALSRDKLSFMDRITLIYGESIFSQLVNPFEVTNYFLGYTIYDINEVIVMFAFDRNDLPLKKLVLGNDYSFNGNIITFNQRFIQVPEFRVSITYKHRIQYHVIDLNKETRNSINRDSGQENLQILPIGGVARRSHYVMDSEGFSKTLLFDNSILP
jgi:hypothetical protein